MVAVVVDMTVVVVHFGSRNDARILEIDTSRALGLRQGQAGTAPMEAIFGVGFRA